MVQSELAAVNAMLTAIGDTPVNDLTVIHSDIQAAINILSDNNITLQSQGWYFNTERWKFNLDRDGKQPIPNNSLFVDTSDVALVKRGSYIYDSVNHTFDLRSNDLSRASLLITTLLPLEELPYIAYSIIVNKAKMQFITELEADATKVQLLNESVQSNIQQLKKLNLQFSEPCALQSPAAIKLLRGTQYYSTYRR